MKKHKVNLDELKVQSFVTSFDNEQDQTREIHGGATGYHFCNSDFKPGNLPVWTITTRA